MHHNIIAAEDFGEKESERKRRVKTKRRRDRETDKQTKKIELQEIGRKKTKEKKSIQKRGQHYFQGYDHNVHSSTLKKALPI